MSIKFLHIIIGNDGLLASSALARKLHITKSDLTEVSGLPKESISKAIIEDRLEIKYGC